MRNDLVCRNFINCAGASAAAPRKVIACCWLLTRRPVWPPNVLESWQRRMTVSRLPRRISNCVGRAHCWAPGNQACRNFASLIWCATREFLMQRRKRLNTIWQKATSRPIPQRCFNGCARTLASAWPQSDKLPSADYADYTDYKNRKELTKKVERSPLLSDFSLICVICAICG